MRFGYLVNDDAILQHFSADVIRAMMEGPDKEHVIWTRRSVALVGPTLGGAGDPWDWEPPATPKARQKPATRKPPKRARHGTVHDPNTTPKVRPPGVSMSSDGGSEAEESRSNQGSEPGGGTDTDTAAVLERRIEHPSEFDDTGGSGDDGAAGIVEDPEKPPDGPGGGCPSGGPLLPVPDLRKLAFRDNPRIHKAPHMSTASCTFCSKLLNASLRILDIVRNGQYPSSVCLKCFRERYDVSDFYHLFDNEEWSVVQGGRQAWDMLSEGEKGEIRRAFNWRRGRTRNQPH